MESILVPAKQQPPKNLVIVLHGQGHRAEFMTDFAKDISESIPGTDVICLQGPIPYRVPEQYVETFGYKEGRQWIRFNNLPDLLNAGVSLLFNRLSVVHDVNAFIDKELAVRNLDDSNLALMGFSMGGGIAMLSGLAREKECAGVVSHSGGIFSYHHIKSRPKFLLIMGDQDPLYNKPEKAEGIKQSLLGFLKGFVSFLHEDTVKRMKNMNLDFKEVVIKGMGHHANPESEKSTIKFLKNSLERAQRNICSVKISTSADRAQRDNIIERIRSIDGVLDVTGDFSEKGQTPVLSSFYGVTVDIRTASLDTIVGKIQNIRGIDYAMPRLK